MTERHRLGGAGGLTRVDLDGGGTIFSTDIAAGPVAAGVVPWEIAIDPAAAEVPAGSARTGSPRR